MTSVLPGPMTAVPAPVTEVVAPAGEYFLGDPCYAVPRDDWMPWLEAADFRNNDLLTLVAAVPSSGAWVVGFNTQDGDGVYPGTDERNYAVDAGLIGLVPRAIITATDEELQRLGSFVTFTSETRCFVDRDPGGEFYDLVFGDIRIKTGADTDLPFFAGMLM